MPGVVQQCGQQVDGTGWRIDVTTCGLSRFENHQWDTYQRIEEVRQAVTLQAAFDKMFLHRVLKNRGYQVPAAAEVRGPDDVLDFADAS